MISILVCRTSNFDIDEMIRFYHLVFVSENIYTRNKHFNWGSLLADNKIIQEHFISRSIKVNDPYYLLNPKNTDIVTVNTDEEFT